MNFYIPVIAHKSGDYIAERDLAACTREQVIRDIYEGQIEDVTQVWCIDPEAGRWIGDVVEDIAQDVGDMTFTFAKEPFPALAEWLDKHDIEYFEAPDEDERDDYAEHNTLNYRQQGIARHAA